VLRVVTTGEVRGDLGGGGRGDLGGGGRAADARRA
jgi:hypothetical protein